MANYSREAWKTYKNVFDTFTENILMKLQGQGHFDELLRPINLGKEANVFLASKADAFVVIKIYRTMNCNFNKMHDYLAHDERYMNIKNQKRKVIFSWVQREYANLFIAREVIMVPTPYVVNNNVLIMELVGHGEEPAPMLKDKPPKNPQAFYDEVRAMMDALKSKNLVHGDLSPFNILNNDERPVFIDFSQGSTMNSPGANELWTRDISNVNTFFARHGAQVRE
jgi:RIO kinase 1